MLRAEYDMTNILQLDIPGQCRIEQVAMRDESCVQGAGCNNGRDRCVAKCGLLHDPAPTELETNCPRMSSSANVGEPGSQMPMDTNEQGK
jgi:hypothetical protein